MTTYNTGRVQIGSQYIQRQRDSMSADAIDIQRLLLDADEFNALGHRVALIASVLAWVVVLGIIFVGG